MKYEPFTIYVDAATIVELRDILDEDAHTTTPERPEIVQHQITQLWNELEARIQHFPAGIEQSADWLGG